MGQASALEIIKLVLQFCGTLGMGGLMTFFITRQINKIERNKEVKQEAKLKQETETENRINVLTVATKLLIRSEMYRMCDKIKNREKMYLYEQEQLRELLEVYTLLHGNGTAHAIVERTLEEYEVVSDLDTLDT